MIFRSLDASGDWVFGSGKAAYATGDIAISLNIRTRILSWLNDCFFAQTSGIDWINRLGLKKQEDLLNLDLRRMITKSYGVAQLISLDTTVTDRHFNGRYEITTIFSPTYVNQINLSL